MKYMTNPSFDKVRELSAKFYRELPQELQDELHEALHRGIDILDSEPQMTAYIFAFGKMHQAKLNYAFDKLSDNFFEQKEINIIDYGCGQAIGTMCYADFIRKNHYSQKVKIITLIEPSEICLKRAALHTSVFFPDAEIKTVNKGFNDLNEKDIICSEETPTLHILSNVLDILNFDIYNFAELIKNNLKGKNQFVCVAPYYNGNEKDNRMDLFASKINGSNIITRKYKANEFMPEKEWTCKISCFQKNYDSFEKIGNSDLEIPISEDIEPHTLYYEANEKIECVRWKPLEGALYFGWIDRNSISHEFANGKGKIRLKNDVTKIGYRAFKYCSGLTSISIPYFVTEIGDNAFDGCKSLESITIPDSVTKIGSHAFRNCESLTSIFIPNSVNEIGKYAFSHNMLNTIIVDRNNPIFDSRYNCNAIIETKTNVLHTGCKNTNIPNSVTKIGSHAFSECKELRYIHIPNSVTEIGDYAFGGCLGLFTVVIPNSVNSIGDYAFSGVKNIVYNKYDEKSPWGALALNGYINKNLLYNNTNKEILLGCNVFSSNATIPHTVKKIGDNAFYGNRLITILVDKRNKKYDSRDNCNAIIETETNTLIAGCKNTTIPMSVTCIGHDAFRGCSELKSIIIPDSVTKIESYAFSECNELTYIHIPNSVTEIEVEAFYGCYNLPKEIREKIEEINGGAFEGFFYPPELDDLDYFINN